MQKEEILVLGDSHANIFLRPQLKLYFPAYEFKVIAAPGGTISGLSNPNSKTQSRAIFHRSMSNTTAKTAIVLMGEVDTGFVIWYRAEKNGIDITEALAKTIHNYKSLLTKVAAAFHTICISAPLPTIRDGQKFGAVANARKDVTATQRERTELTIEFNRQVEAFCHRSKILNLNLDSESLGANGLVKTSLLHQNSADHHYDQSAYATMIGAKLPALIESRNSPG